MEAESREVDIRPGSAHQEHDDQHGKVVQVSTRVVSADGRTATFTTVGTDERGRKVHDVTVFERQ